MQLSEILEILEPMGKSSFALLSAETLVSPGIRKFTNASKVILFREPSYVTLVKQRLGNEGKLPDDFVVGETWGDRLPHLPIISYKPEGWLEGSFYLQTILDTPGNSWYRVGRQTLSVEDMEKSGMLPRGRHTNQGLSEGNEVLVHTYLIDNISELKLL